MKSWFFGGYMFNSDFLRSHPIGVGIPSHHGFIRVTPMPVTQGALRIPPMRREDSNQGDLGL